MTQSVGRCARTECSNGQRWKSVRGTTPLKVAPGSWWGLCFAGIRGRARSHHVLPGVAADERQGQPVSKRVTQANWAEVRPLWMLMLVLNVQWSIETTDDATLKILPSRGTAGCLRYDYAL